MCAEPPKEPRGDPGWAQGRRLEGAARPAVVGPPTGGCAASTAQARERMSSGSGESVAELRAEIDRLDRHLLETLAERRVVVGALTEVKRHLGLFAVDRAREKNLEETWSAAATKLGLPTELALNVLSVILEASRRDVVEALRDDRSAP